MTPADAATELRALRALYAPNPWRARHEGEPRVKLAARRYEALTLAIATLERAPQEAPSS